MEKYAIIKLGGKQFMVQEGTKFSIERQNALNPEVLLFSDGKEIIIGDPLVSGIAVKMEFVEEDVKARKIRVARFRNKSRHRRVQGHRQPMSIVKVSSIGKAGVSAEKSEKTEKVEKPKKVTPKAVKKPAVKKASKPKSVKSSKGKK